MGQKCEHSGTGCWAHLEWFCEHHCGGVARVFGGSQEYGDDYCYALPFVVRQKFDPLDGFGRLGMLEFVGVTKIMSHCQVRALWKAAKLAKYGVLSSRMVNGKLITRECGANTWQPLRNE